jgi:hypothetical protein
VPLRHRSFTGVEFIYRRLGFRPLSGRPTDWRLVAGRKCLLNWLLRTAVSGMFPGGVTEAVKRFVMSNHFFLPAQ